LFHVYQNDTPLIVADRDEGRERGIRLHDVGVISKRLKSRPFSGEKPTRRPLIGDERWRRYPGRGAGLELNLQGVRSEPDNGRPGWHHLGTKGADHKGAEPEVDDVYAFWIRFDTKTPFQRGKVTLGQGDPQSIGSASPLHPAHALEKGDHSRPENPIPDDTGGHCRLLVVRLTPFGGLPLSNLDRRHSRPLAFASRFFGASHEQHAGDRGY
jgi:hypothetical protein